MDIEAIRRRRALVMSGMGAGLEDGNIYWLATEGVDALIAEVERRQAKEKELNQSQLVDDEVLQLIGMELTHWMALAKQLAEAIRSGRLNDMDAALDAYEASQKEQP